jgi:hypothetical protein
MMVRLVALLGVALVMQAQASPPQQKPSAANPLFRAQHLACSFNVYAAPVWKDGAAQVVSRAQDFTFDIDGIDMKKNSANIVGKGGASAHASTVTTQIGLNVIEATPIGNLNVTTVFAAGGPAGKYIAVHSRHIGDLTSAPSPSQNYGTCEIVK